jgi:dGTPase
MATKREDRQGGGVKQDQRSAFQIDRDRVLYSHAFRRLQGVTQVVSSGEGEIFHNRLIHTLKVAQIARRLAEMLLGRTNEEKEAAEAWGGIDPDLVEAAALAHDLGHPPFGHIAEDELNHLVAEAKGSGTAKDAEGYEGNAQSFRIVTRLAIRRPGSRRGLDLTRATLNGILKYPWLWSSGRRKYGAYVSDKEAFQFARDGFSTGNRSIKAQIMDWADDIAYSVHDTEDFYRAGLIPLDRLAIPRPVNTTRDDFLKMAFDRRKAIDQPFAENPIDLQRIFDQFCDSLRTNEPYSGSRGQRECLYEFTSKTISDYVQQTKLLPPPGDKGNGLQIPAPIRCQVALLKELTWCYVINNQALAGQQHGQRLAIRTLFEVFRESASKGRWVIFPPPFREEAEVLLRDGQADSETISALAADTVASLTDQQALHLFRRLSGQSPGSVLDPIFT